LYFESSYVVLAYVSALSNNNSIGFAFSMLRISWYKDVTVSNENRYKILNKNYIIPTLGGIAGWDWPVSKMINV
jgi:hypothetical protein